PTAPGRERSKAAGVRDSQPSAPEIRRGVARGKHAAPADLAITVRSLPAVRDAVVEGLPVAKRAAGSIREWALYTGDKRPATGRTRSRRRRFWRCSTSTG